MSTVVYPTRVRPEAFFSDSPELDLNGICWEVFDSRCKETGRAAAAFRAALRRVAHLPAEEQGPALIGSMLAIVEWAEREGLLR